MPRAAVDHDVLPARIVTCGFPPLLLGSDARSPHGKSVKRISLGAAVTAVALGTATLAHAVSTTVSFSAPVVTDGYFTTLSSMSASGDFTSDGIPDVVTAVNGTPSVIDVIPGERNGGFGAPLPSTRLTGSDQVAGIAVGDVNNDGFLDAVVSSYVPSDEIYIALGDGRGSFTVWAPMGLDVKPSALALADMNSDGNLDLVFGTEEDPSPNRQVGVSLGLGNGTFGVPTGAMINNVGTAQAIAIGYINGDSNLDVATSNGTSASASVLFGDGSGGLTFNSTIDFAAFDSNIIFSWGIGISDFDSDGLGELAVSVNGNSDAGGLLLVGTNFSPTSITRYRVNATPGLLTVGDVTLDGIPDVVSAWTGSDELIIWPGLGNGLLATPPYTEAMGLVPGGSGAFRPMLVDFDSNGVPDVIVAGQIQAIATVFNLLNPPQQPSPRYEFTYRLPDGRECGSISPQSVISGTWVTLPGSDAACTIGSAHIIGWRIGGQEWAFSPGQKVRVSDSQQFTAQLSIIEVTYDANVGAGDACVADGHSVDSSARTSSSYVQRSALAAGSQPSSGSAPCTPPGHTLIGWSLREGNVSLRAGDALPQVAGTTDAMTLFAQWRAVETR